MTGNVRSKLVWEIEKNEVNGQEMGTFGFTLLDGSETLYNRAPSFEDKNGKEIVRGKVTEIKFETNTNDGLHARVQLWEKVEDTWEIVDFVCQDWSCKNSISRIRQKI